MGNKEHAMRTGLCFFPFKNINKSLTPEKKKEHLWRVRSLVTRGKTDDEHGVA